MTKVQRTQRKKLIREAEGYLELIMAFESDWELELPTKRTLANRALQALEQIKRPLGHKPYILFLKGQACRAINDFGRAVNYFQQSAQLDPDNIHTYLALGWCHKRLDRTDLAIEAMETAIQIDGESAIAHYNLACYFALGRQVKLAVLYLSNAFELNPEYRDYVESESDFDAIREDPEFISSLDMIA